jgi:hypothetical protein
VRRLLVLFALSMRITWLVIALLMGSLLPPVAGVQANIRWSPQAQQQVRDWANGGAQPWTHTIQRQLGPNGHYR